MTPAFRRYNRVIDEIRTNRRVGIPEHSEEMRALFAELDEHWRYMYSFEQWTAHAETWRAWPDKFDARMKAFKRRAWWGLGIGSAQAIPIVLFGVLDWVPGIVASGIVMAIALLTAHVYIDGIRRGR